LSYTHPTRRDLPVLPLKAIMTPPILHSFSVFSFSFFFPSQVAQIEIYKIPLFNSIITFSQYFPVRPLSLFALSRYLSPFPKLVLSPRFPRRTLTYMRLFTPRCFNHLYLFHFSALFFSALPINKARFSPDPLIHLYARRCTRHFPECFHPIVYPLQRLDRPKQA
jgi:hypothetical protein